MLASTKDYAGRGPRMMSPAWLLHILAALMLVVAAVSATRLVTARLPANRPSAAEPTRPCLSPRSSSAADTDIAHLLMGIAMAGMLAPSVKTLPPHAWEAIFGLLTAWFAWRLAGDTKLNGLRSLVGEHRAAHLFHCLAMVYMLVPLTTSNGMDVTGMGSGLHMTAMCSGMARSLPALAQAFVFVLLCYSVWDLLGHLSGRRYNLEVTPSAGVAPAGDTAPVVACRFTMGVTMAFMLLIMS
jgi:hypothetical protein